MTRIQDMLEGLDDHTLTAMREWGIPGLAVTIVKEDGIVLSKGFGVRALGGREAVDGKTLFAIGSNTKAFTSLALGMLVQEGRLSWDDPVIRHLPGFQFSDAYVTREIRVRDLLCHRSGLATWSGDLLAYGSTYTRADLLRRIRFLQPVTGFRYAFGYMNLMFLVAGQIVQDVSGMSWDDFIRQRIFEPLGMSRSCTSTKDLERLGNYALPHELINGQVTSLPYRNLDNLAPAGAINSCVQDLAQWLRLQLGNGVYAGKPLVAESILEEIRTPHTPISIPPEGRKLIPSRHFYAYGLGWFLMDYHGRLVIRHDGGIDGMLSLVAFVPEEKLGIAVLSNLDPQNFYNALCYTILDAFLDVPFTDWNRVLLEGDKEAQTQAAGQKAKLVEARARDTHPTLALEAYCGEYTNPLYGEASIGMQGGKLTLRLSAHPAILGNMEHWHYDTFLCHWNDPVFDQSLLPFTTDGQGRVETFRLRVREDMIDPLEYEFRKKDG